jgi:hypothetical protein
MASNEQADATSWLPVIGKALAYLCLSRAVEREPEKYGDVLKKVKFLEGLGLSQNDAAEAVGSTAKSVGVMRSRKKKKAKAKKKTRSGR